MANPQVPQGTLLRSLTSLQVVNFPQLNVVTGFFANKAARLAFEGLVSDYIPNLGGATPSPRLFQVCTATVYIAKSTTLAALWETQRLTNSLIGDINMITDSPTLSGYYFQNCTIQNIPDLELTGENNDFTVIIQGTYPINNSLF